MLPETAQYRRSNEALQAMVARQLLAVWPALESGNLDGSFPTWLQLLSVIVGRGRALSTALTRDYLAAFGEPSPSPADAVPPAKFAKSAYGSVISAKQVIGDGRTVEEAMQVAYVRSLGAMGNLVLDAGRTSVINTTATSERFSGWRRVASGGGCPFCRMLAGRGAVYQSDQSAHFASHRHCTCSAEPVGTNGMSSGQRAEVADYQRSARSFSDADRARVREWMRSNP